MITRLAIYLLLPFLALAANTASGAELALNAEDASMGERELRIPVSLRALGADSVAALQFDLYFDAALLTFARVEAGSAADAGEKATHANVIRPGQVRVVIAGLNRNTMPEGVAAWVVLARTTGPRAPVTLSLDEAILSDPFGTAVAVRINPDTLSIDSDATVAVTSNSGTNRGMNRGVEALVRYRALLFAAVLVGLGMLLSRRAPRKGRIR